MLIIKGGESQRSSGFSHFRCWLAIMRFGRSNLTAHGECSRERLAVADTVSNISNIIDNLEGGYLNAAVPTISHTPASPPGENPSKINPSK